MIESTLGVVQGDLIGTADRRLTSTHVNDYEPVFTGPWFNDRPRPRFADSIWEISGVDPSPTHSTFRIEFSHLSPEWSLITREVLYFRANLRKIRHLVTLTDGAFYTDFRSGTIISWRASLCKIAELADLLDIGIPAHWTLQDTEELRSHIVANPDRSWVVGIVGV